MEDVTASTAEPLPFPEVVAQFGQADCTLLGRLAHTPDPAGELLGEQSPTTAYRGRAARPPLAVLITPDRQTLVAVDTLAGQPFIRLRSVLGNGDLVETVQRDRVPPTHPDPVQPAARDVHHAAPGRRVQVTTFWDARESLKRHSAFVAARAGKARSTPETLDSMAEALLVWEAADRHDRLVNAHGERIAVNGRTWLLAGAVLASLLIAIVLVVSAVPYALIDAGGFAGLAIGTALLAGTQLTRWLFGVRRLRPRFALG